MSQIATFDQVHLSLESAAGSVHILKGINLDIAKARSLAILGPSGSGKSTLLMALTGLERLSSGEVTIDGAPLSNMDEDALAAFRLEKMGIVFQNFHLIETMTALENVSLPLEMKKEKNVAAKAAKALEEVGLGERLDHYPAQLSGGEQQRVALARGIVARPKMLVADEPTGNLDQKTGAQIIDLMFKLGQQHAMTLVLITHDKALAQKCDRQVELVDGKIIYDSESKKSRAVKKRR